MNNMRKILVAGAIIFAFGTGRAADPYKLITTVGAEHNGKTVYLRNGDSNELTDSAVVADGSAVFKGELDEPYAGFVVVDGRASGPFIVELGTAAADYSSRKAFGSPLNDKFNDIKEQMNVIAATYNAEAPEEEQKAVIDRYNAFSDSVMRDNLDNPIGYLLLRDKVYEMTADQLGALMASEPTLANSKYLSNSLEMLRKRDATGEGCKYADFEVNGQKLSDYVGRDGKYLLVDFWASWCGPCRREIPGIKKLLEENSDKMNVLGVAVWDEPDATRDAMERLGITWPVIIDAQRIPTDIYGILGIPTILLISPDGTILVRDKQGDDLKTAVEAALGK